MERLPGRRPRRTWRRMAMLAGVATLASFALPTVSASAAAASLPASLKALLAKATRLANQIDSLSEQYDGLGSSSLSRRPRPGSPGKPPAATPGSSPPARPWSARSPRRAT